MLVDRRGLELTANGATAVECYDLNVRNFLASRRETPQTLDATFAADPDMLLAHCAKGFLCKLLARAELHAPATAALAAARRSQSVRGCNARERSYVDALGRWCTGDLEGTARLLDDVLVDYPTDVFALRLSHAVHFLIGNRIAMRDVAARVLSAWDESIPEFAFVLGCYAFGLEECGEFITAEETGRRGVDLDPWDAWGAHAVAHVMEMCGRPKEGIAWLRKHRQHWSGCNNFAYHLYWHEALFHLELEETDAALGLYDQAIRANKTDDFRDISNAASLLWRLEREGVDVGARWEELADKACARIGDHELAFANAHYLLALLGAGRVADGRAMLESMREASAGNGTEASVLGSVGVPLAEAYLAYQDGDCERTLQRLLPLRRRLQSLGGSNAQRDLFEQFLIEAALDAGQYGVAQDLLAERSQRYPRNRWGSRRMLFAAQMSLEQHPTPESFSLAALG